jgi:hypothetical protein
MRKLYPDFNYAGVLEVQSRGAYHTHFLVVGPIGKIGMEYMRACAVKAGYGPRIQLHSAEHRLRAGCSVRLGT